MKRFTCLVLAFLMSVSFLTVGASASSNRSFSSEEYIASQLKSLNLFKGVSDTDVALEKTPSRIEALVIMLRLLGKENDILAGSYASPFTDVPDWAAKYVGYAYENGLTKGSSATQFGTGTATDSQFMTFVLRALGYSDSEGDFTWDNPYDLASELGVLTDSVVKGSGFLRAACATISYNAISAKLKGSEKILADKLISEGVFTKTDYEKVKSNTEKYASTAVPELAISHLKTEGENVYYSIKTVDPNYKSVVSNTIIIALGLAGNYDNRNSYTVAELKNGVTASWPKSVFDSYQAKGGKIFAAYAEGELDAFYTLPKLEVTQLSSDANGQSFHLKIDENYTCPYTNLIIVHFSTADHSHNRAHGFTIDELRKGIDYEINDSRYAGVKLNPELHFAF